MIAVVATVGAIVALLLAGICGITLIGAWMNSKADGVQGVNVGTEAAWIARRRLVLEHSVTRGNHIAPRSLAIGEEPMCDKCGELDKRIEHYHAILARILDGMKSKDGEKIAQGQIKETEALSYSVDEDPSGLIKSITINNYREKERLNEIFNTSSWVFTRMLEKSGQQ